MKTILVSAAVAVLLLPSIAFGQAEKEIDNPAAATATTWLPNTLFKLGTGLSRESGYGSYSGLELPITLGVEHQFTRKIYVYGNLSPMLRTGGRYYAQNNDVPFLRLSGINADLGARYYYNQAKREQRGRAHGPFVGNYLAVQVGTDFNSQRYQNSFNARRYYNYDYSDVSLVWGMQRRIGKWGLFDGNAGLGVGNSRIRYQYDPNNGSVDTKRSLSLLLELNARISLAH